MDNALIVEARKKYHRTLIDKCVLTLSAEGVASNADSSSAPSKSIAEIIARKMGAATGTKLKGQTAGKLFEQITMQFVAILFHTCSTCAQATGQFLISEIKMQSKRRILHSMSTLHILQH